MSVTRFKVDDKVRVREGAVTHKYCDNVYIGTDIAKPGSEVSTVVFAGKDIYKLEGDNNSWWKGEMLELIEKTLHDLCAGDFVRDMIGTKKILAKVDGCYLLSAYEEYTDAGSWYTVSDLKKLGYSFVELNTPEPTIEIDGKKYKKFDVEKAIKDLEPIE